jgi:Fe-S-cluster containining protein
VTRASDAFDCRRCGACCANLPSNRAEQFTSWVEVEPGDRVLARPDLVRRHVVVDDDGVAHLRLAPDGRCLALRGTLGVRASCTMYHHRPSPCRRVQPGDDLCLRYRAEHGIRDSVPTQ